MILTPTFLSSFQGLWKSVDIEEIVGKFGLVCISRSGTDPNRYIYENDVLNKLR